MFRPAFLSHKSTSIPGGGAGIASSTLLQRKPESASLVKTKTPFLPQISLFTVDVTVSPGSCLRPDQKFILGLFIAFGSDYGHFCV